MSSDNLPYVPASLCVCVYAIYACLTVCVYAIYVCLTVCVSRVCLQFRLEKHVTEAAAQGTCGSASRCGAAKGHGSQLHGMGLLRGTAASFWCGC